MVCTGESGGTQADLRAYVAEFNPDGTGGQIIFNFKLDYTKGPIKSSIPADAKWETWRDDFYTDPNAGNAFNEPGNANYPQPILSDIEFDIDGSMILGFLDRNGNMGGHRNAIPTDITKLVNISSGGDMLRVYKDNGIFTLENNGTVKNSITGVSRTSDGGNGNSEGPGGGEFYFMDCVDCNETNGKAGFHDEIFIGGLALLPGSDEVLSSVFDPINLDSGGLQWNSNTTGRDAHLYQFYYGAGTKEPRFGKASGLGDVEILCNAAPIEIGNRIFMDTNSDGIQDPNEMGLDGITVKLYKAGIEVGTTTTANGGQWFFTNLDSETDYEVKVLAASFPAGKSITTSNTASNSKDMIDSDASLVGTDAVITYKTGSAGQNNHTLDFGFKTASTCNLASTATTSNPTCVNNDGAINLTVTGATGTPTYLWSNAATSEDLSAISAGDYTVTVTDGACTTVATYSVSVTPANQITPICIGESYQLMIQDNTLTGIQWKKNGADIAGANALTYTATEVGIYTYTSNGVGGCAVGQCCPIELTLNPSCCKPKVCTTVKITRN